MAKICKMGYLSKLIANIITFTMKSIKSILTNEKSY